MRQSVIRSGQIFAEINLLTVARFSDKMFCLMIEVTPEVTVNYTKDFKTITVKLSKNEASIEKKHVNFKFGWIVSTIRRVYLYHIDILGDSRENNSVTSNGKIGRKRFTSFIGCKVCLTIFGYMNGTLKTQQPVPKVNNAKSFSEDVKRLLFGH